MDKIISELYFLFDLALSAFLGFIIGFERKQRSKEAGIRTHTIVSFGSALLMIISKYAFESNADTARIAAQVVSGIGFLGAGMIVYRKNVVRGLTTAAGVWATAGIGMACGAKMYVLACGATLILVGVQCLFHIKCNIFSIKKSYELKIIFKQTDNENEKIKEIFGVQHFKKLNISRIDDKALITVTLTTETEYRSEVLTKILQDNQFIVSIDRCMED